MRRGRCGRRLLFLAPGINFAVGWRRIIEEGGDWDRRNRLKVYEATFLMSIRSFKRASELFIDTLATFTSTELMDLKTFVRYAIISSIVSQDRVTLKNKVIDAPEVLEVIKELHPLQPLLESLHECRYRDFFVALAETEQQLKVDALLNAHYVYFTREMRIRYAPARPRSLPI